MIDALMIYMALTLALAGLFLFRDHVRFLRGTHSVIGKVTSIQHVFITRLSGEDQSVDKKGYVENGFYPVIEYDTKGGKVSFTAIDPAVSGDFHVGEPVRLKISRSRRKENRVCRSASLLALMLVTLCGTLLADLMLTSVNFHMESIFLASGVIAICLAILVSYARDRDETGCQTHSRSQGGKAQLCLSEPMAFNKWPRNSRDPIQSNKIRSKQFFGATCICSAMLMVAITV